MSRYLLLPLFALWCFSPCLYADANLEVSLEGLEGELQRNALAWLGVPPESSQERLIYVASVEQKIERSLQALGYYRPYIEVEVQRTDPVWQVSIRVTPGDPVLIRHVSVQLSGEAGQDEAFTALLETAPFAQGEALHHGKFEDFRRQLLALGLQRGYFNGEISTGRVEVEPEGLTADVFLHYASGRRYRFGRVLYDREQIESSVMSSLRTFQPGDHFDQSLMQEFQALLQRTNYFSTVLLRPMLEQADGDEVPIELRLFPAERHSFDVGIGYSTDTEERLSVTWRTPKINRAGHRQETDSNQKELGVRREQRAGNWVRSFSLRGLNESWQIVDFRRDNDYLLPGVSFSRRNRAGSPVNPTSGFSRLYVVEAGSEYLGSDIDLLRAQATLRRVFTPAPRHRFVARSEIGAVFVSDDDRPNLAPSLSFFTGGSQSIRGFGYQSIGHEIDVELEDGSETTLVIGGTRLFTASAEYQYSFTDAWRGAVFADGGDAFDEDDFDFNYSAGVGVHFVTLVGAIRLELAYPLSKDDPSWRFHFAIGVPVGWWRPSRNLRLWKWPTAAVLWPGNCG
jgi:translocation and assembly module TamA